MICLSRFSSPLGDMTMAADGAALTGLWFDGQKHFPAHLTGVWAEAAVFADTRRWLEQYFGGQIPDFLPKLRPAGTVFQKTVWELLRTIPYGQTVTYGELAALLGLRPMSARAVGNAVGRNPISLIIPCHRVLGAGGRLTGYAGGLDRKRALLSLEGIAED